MYHVQKLHVQGVDGIVTRLINDDMPRKWEDRIEITKFAQKLQAKCLVKELCNKK